MSWLARELRCVHRAPKCVGCAAARSLTRAVRGRESVNAIGENDHLPLPRQESARIVERESGASESPTFAMHTPSQQRVSRSRTGRLSGRRSDPTRTVLNGSGDDWTPCSSAGASLRYRPFRFCRAANRPLIVGYAQPAGVGGARGAEVAAGLVRAEPGGWTAEPAQRRSGTAAVGHGGGPACAAAAAGDAGLPRLPRRLPRRPAGRQVDELATVFSRRYSR